MYYSKVPSEEEIDAGELDERTQSRPNKIPNSKLP
jgi:hypothetical protein